MTLQPGRRLGPYEILSALGAGGMGEVYKARDTRLDRTVALKVLPASLAERPDRRERFEREARAVSALSHPHICTLHDIGRHEGIDFLVMEHLEGDTLAERLSRGALPLEQALRCATEIASALDAAHRRGITHRDLKPGNIMLTKAGTKLLDFGLAKLREAGAGQAAPPPSGAGAPNLSEIPTRSQPLTAEGTLLGTLQYMAPEQLEGKEADARTDLFAFGLVLYEMVTGRKAFEGKNQASLIAAIMGREPAPISVLQPMTPPALERLVKRCLAKDPDDRWQTARDLTAEIQWISEGRVQHGAPALHDGRRTRRELLGWVIAGLALVLALLLVLKGRGREETPRQVMVSSLILPGQAAFDPTAGPMALSPDGRRLAFVGRSGGEPPLLWVREFDGTSAKALERTEGALMPFWSPDSRHVAFFADGMLKKIDTAGGVPESVCAAESARGGSWGQKAVILFGMSENGPIQSVPAAGGTAHPVTTLNRAEGESSHVWPSFLPGGNHFIYHSVKGRAPAGMEVYLTSLDGSGPELLMTAAQGVTYAPPGYLLIWREGSLRAQPFDLQRREVGAESFLVRTDIEVVPNLLIPLVSVSTTGVLVYSSGTLAAHSQLLWFDRAGRPAGAVGPPANYYNQRLSRDGRRVAVDISDAQDKGDIWTLDVAQNVSARFTFDPANESCPLWSPDGREISFISEKEGRKGDIFRRTVTGAGTEELVFESATLKALTGVSSDGKFLVINTFGEQEDIWIYSTTDKKVTPFLTSKYKERDGQFSPDGRWLVYTSDESGRTEVYVRAYPGPEETRRVSSDGGTMPGWGPDGSEIFYLAPDDRLISVAVITSPRFHAEGPKALFKVRIKKAWWQRQYDVSPDGQRFLINTPVEEKGASTFTLVTNWDAALEQK